MTLLLLLDRESSDCGSSGEESGEPLEVRILRHDDVGLVWYGIRVQASVSSGDSDSEGRGEEEAVSAPNGS